jgi:hypothetical protein
MILLRCWVMYIISARTHQIIFRGHTNIDLFIRKCLLLLSTTVFIFFTLSMVTQFNTKFIRRVLPFSFVAADSSYITTFHGYWQVMVLTFIFFLLLYYVTKDMTIILALHKKAGISLLFPPN